MHRGFKPGRMSTGPASHLMPERAVVHGERGRRFGTFGDPGHPNAGLDAAARLVKLELNSKEVSLRPRSLLCVPPVHTVWTQSTNLHCAVSCAFSPIVPPSPPPPPCRHLPFCTLSFRHLMMFGVRLQVDSENNEAYRSDLL